MRNHVFVPDVALRVRQLAGVVDQVGDLMPGYALSETDALSINPLHVEREKFATLAQLSRRNGERAPGQ
jgi:hypothetical protein